jgi:ribosomal protein S18 acetylase RimI-like enzyme
VDKSVYVTRECRKRGVYRAMYAFVKTLADKTPEVCGFRLYVEKHNLRAQKTYQTLGMEETHYQMYEEELSRK